MALGGGTRVGRHLAVEADNIGYVAAFQSEGGLGGGNTTMVSRSR